MSILAFAISLPLAIATPPDPRQDGGCTATPRQDLLPTVIAPMAGQAPIWFIDSGNGAWAGADAPVKSVWVIQRHSSAALTVTGRQLDGSGSVSFARTIGSPRVSRLGIADPTAESMLPGGASVDVLRAFAFVSSYVFYPNAGCWEITSEIGSRRQSIVVAVK